MPIRAAQKRSLRRALRFFGAANGIATVPGGGGKALEAWVLMRLARHARALSHWRVTLMRGDGAPLLPGGVFEFSTSQAGIQAASLQAPCYVLLEDRRDPRKQLELHCGLIWRGRSGATHEIDVSAIPAAIAGTLRSGHGGVPRGLPIIAVECKDKTSTGIPDEMRQTLARMFDLALVTRPPPPIGECRIYEDVTHSRWGQRSSSYIDFFGLGTFAVVRAGKFSLGAAKIAVHYQIKQCGEVYRQSGPGLTVLEQSLRTTLASLASF